MAVRVRKDGRILCAAMHPAEPGDVYIDDGVHYQLSVIAEVLVTDEHHLDKDGVKGHGQWWWITDTKKPPVGGSLT
jgi:hypothetical protein